MKVGLCGDVHWSGHSSIVWSRGDRFSTRLENLIQSINWFNELVVKNNCDIAVFMGDFFDRPDCTAEEAAALISIIWPNIPLYFLCGNHEMGKFDHEYSIAKLFELPKDSYVISSPGIINIPEDGHKTTELCFLPYILESNRERIDTYFGPRTSNDRIILSHNDISGVQMGAFISQIGFSVDEIEENCDLFINGHLHNGLNVTNKIINIGNITGQNFSEDASVYEHHALILDTNTLHIDAFENPVAMNFYKLDATSHAVDLLSLKNNAVITLKCGSEDAPKFKNQIAKLPNILESRVIIELSKAPSAQEEYLIEDLSVDHLEEFRKFIKSTIGTGDIVDAELEEICK